MNRLLSQIFKNRTPNAAKLEKYGFEGGAYKTRILNGQFELLVNVENGDINTLVTEIETDEPYTLFLADGATGSFVGEVRAEYTRVLSDIAEKCFDGYVYKGEQSRAVIDYIRKTYANEPEFLWEKFDDTAIWRRSDNKKWYAVIMTLAKKKLGLQSDETAEIIDLRIEPENMQSTLDYKTFFLGYHMNKKHWITVILNGSEDDEKIFKMIDTSYRLALKK